MICEHWFPTPIWYTNFTNITDQQYKEAAWYCENMAASSTGVVKSNVGGWQSESKHIDSFYNTPLSVFREQIDTALARAYKDLGVNSAGQHINIWINVNKKDDFNRRHTHPASYISGVFYITDTTSDIIFERPDTTNAFIVDSMNSNHNTPLSFCEVRYKPRRGMLILFPSWLVHRVERNTIDSSRISIAFNTKSY